MKPTKVNEILDKVRMIKRNKFILEQDRIKISKLPELAPDCEDKGLDETLAQLEKTIGKLLDEAAKESLKAYEIKDLPE